MMAGSRNLLDVTHVLARPDYKLLLAFENGDVRIFDMRPQLDRKPFDRLRDPAEFAAAFVDLGTVCWPGEIDIDPETLYDGSAPADRETLKYELEKLVEQYGDKRMTEADWGPDVGFERLDPPPGNEHER